jgi:hypothetical protein
MGDEPPSGLAELLSRDQLILCDDLRTRSEAASAAFRKGGRGGTAGERREDSADDHPPERQIRSLCLGFFRAGTVSPRRSRIRRDMESSIKDRAFLRGRHATFRSLAGVAD